ncbi:MAG: hypothetical protein KDC92_00145 [Bacteroidetes bacterium]|nr:hypothetical protein [Bacteroidota bacterium]
MKRLIITLLVYAVFYVKAQDCSNSLYKAEIAFEQGRIQEAIDILEPCSKKQGNTEKSLESAKLLALAYLAKNNQEKAGYYAKEMLQIFPRYKEFPNNDPPELTELLTAYIAAAKLHVGGYFSSGITNVNLVNSYSALRVPQAYYQTPYFNAGGFLEFPVNRHFTVCVNAGASGTTVTHYMKSDYEWDKTYTNQLRFTGFGAGLNYKLLFGESGILTFGPIVNYHRISTANMQVLTQNGFTATREIVAQDGLPFLNKSQLAVGCRLGVEKNLTRGRVGVMLKYTSFLNLINNPDQRYSDMDFVFESAYILDDVKLGFWGISLQYSLPVLYKIENATQLIN